MNLFIIDLSENTLLYLYSTFIQANAAILAVYGFYIIYKIQSLHSGIEILKSDLIRNQAMIQPIKISEFDSSSLDGKKKIVDVMDKGELFYFHFTAWFKKEEIISRMKSYIIYPTLYLTSAMIIDSVCLLFSTNLYHYHFLYSIYLIYVVVILHIIIWLIIALKIISVIKKE